MLETTARNIPFCIFMILPKSPFHQSRMTVFRKILNELHFFHSQMHFSESLSRGYYFIRLRGRDKGAASETTHVESRI